MAGFEERWTWEMAPLDGLLRGWTLATACSALSPSFPWANDRAQMVIFAMNRAHMVQWSGTFGLFQLLTPFSFSSAATVT